LQLPLVAQALCCECLDLGFGQSWQKHGRQDGNDGDDHKQLYQGESGGTICAKRRTNRFTSLDGFSHID
jgi:hypothetical protein